MATPQDNSLFQGQVCWRCLMDQSDPRITFDAQGVCSHCQNFDQNILPIWTPNTDSPNQLETMRQEILKHRKGDYDCALGISGGVDSCYLLHVVKKQLGLNPLVVHVDAGWNTEIAVANIHKMVEKLKVDLYTEVIDWNTMRDLHLAFLKSSVPNQDIPQDHAFMSTLQTVPAQLGISCIVNGFNYATESVLPKAWVFTAADGHHVKSIHQIFTGKSLKKYPLLSLVQQKYWYPKVVKQKKFAPLNYVAYGKNKAMSLLMSEYDWKYYGGKHYESRWTEFFQSYYLPTKFGWDKRKPHLSSAILAGEITREEGLAELAKPLYDEKRILDLKNYVASKLQLSVDELEGLVALPNRRHEDYPSHQYLVRWKKKIVAAIRPQPSVF